MVRPVPTGDISSSHKLFARQPVRMTGTCKASQHLHCLFKVCNWADKVETQYVDKVENKKNPLLVSNQVNILDHVRTNAFENNKQ